MDRKSMVLVALVAGCGGMDNGYGDGSFEDSAAFLAFGSSDSAITLAWVPVPDAAGYLLERRSDADDFEPIAALGPTTIDYLDVELSRTTYTYRIRAFGDSGVSTGITQTATPSDDEAWTTPDEVITGVPIVQTVSASGATIVTADGQATITIPPQAFPGDTELTLMSIANPIPGDPRPGLDVSFSQDFVQPIRISFQSDESEADDLVIVRKQDDGTWLAQRFVVDASTVTMTLPVDDATAAGARLRPGPAPSRSHARVLPPLRSTFLAPRLARVGLSGTTSFSPYGLFSDFPCAILDQYEQGFCDAFYPLSQLMRTIKKKAVVVPLANMEPGYVRTWSVDGVIGGDATHGTIAPTASYGGFYVAPASVPPGCGQPCRVPVTFNSRNTSTGVTAPTTRALVELIPSSWAGTVTSTSVANINTSTVVTWQLDASASDSTVSTYVPDATVTPTMQVEDCVVTVNWVYISTESVLTIDYRLVPPTYSAVGSGSMNVTMACTNGSGTYDLALTWMPRVTNQPLLTNASEISGHQDTSVESFTWEFHPGS